MKEVKFAINDHFFDFINDWHSKVYVTVGGYGSSKSYHVAAKLIKKLLEEKRKALVVREVFDTLRDSCFDLLEEVATTMGVNDSMKFVGSPMQIRFSNGSRIIFKGMDKPAKVKSLNGVSIVWLEECSEIKYEGFKELLGRLRHFTMSNHFILSTNPISKQNWCYKHFFKDSRRDVFILDDNELYGKRIIRKGNTYYHHSTVDDNFFVPQSYIEQLDELKIHDPDLYRIARHGKFGATGTLVFPQFEVMQHSKMLKEIKAIEGEVLLKNGMDFGFVTSYNALLRLAIDHDSKTLYILSEYYSKGKTDGEIERDIKEFKRTKELIKADCAEPKAIKYYKDQGFRMRACKKFQGSRRQYTKKIKRFKRIVCSSKCPFTREELEELTFKLDKFGEVIEDEFTIDPHTLSAIWYALDDYEVSNLKGGAIGVLK